MIWLQITSGRGPEECEWVVQNVLDKLILDGRIRGYRVIVLESATGNQGGALKSALCSIEGNINMSWVHEWEGTILWKGRSPYRTYHKRKNWFIGVKGLSITNDIVLSDKDIKVATMCASGPGGQNVNKVETAVRITHIPTGLSVKAQEERSQFLNKRLAMARLIKKLNERAQKQNEKNSQLRWLQHNFLERGNPIRIYEGSEFILRKK